jgi:hypothetical protein
MAVYARNPIVVEIKLPHRDNASTFGRFECAILGFAVFAGFVPCNEPTVALPILGTNHFWTMNPSPSFGARRPVGRQSR